MKDSLLNDVITESSGKVTGKSFGSFLHGYSKMKSLREGSDTKSLAKELALFIESNDSISSQIPDIKKTVFKHWKKGEYNGPLAERAWGRGVSDGAKKYAQDVIKEARLWESIFPSKVRQIVIEGLALAFYNDLKKGKVNLEEMFNE